MADQEVAAHYIVTGGSLTDADAAAVGPHLDALRKVVPPERLAKAVVDAARPEAAPLHGYFEWHDDVAAERYRRAQARRLIRYVVRAPVSPPAAAAPRAVHHRERLPGPDALSRAVTVREALADAETELLRWRNRHDCAAFRERFAPVLAAITTVCGTPRPKLRQCVECLAELPADATRVRCDGCSVAGRIARR